MKDRITQFLVKENISPAEFADKIGVQRSSVSHVLNGRNYPGASFIQKMLSTYRNLNPRWLLLGEGNMLDLPVSIKKEPSLFADNQTLNTGEKDISPQVALEGKDKTVFPDQQVVPEKTVEPLTSIASKLSDQTHEMHEILSKNLDNKNIESIVLFFTDKTFTSYAPSK
jgi:transcriptional regulator with XRE-family HTH domain